jgi:hypothetical protein
VIPGGLPGGILACLLLVLLAGWYLSLTAARLDRLHHRIEVSRAALDAQLVRRAASASEVAALLDPASGRLLAGVAGKARQPPIPAGDWPVIDEHAQSGLTQALGTALGSADSVARLQAEPLAAHAIAGLAEACTRVQLARRFHNDAVAQASRVRRKRIVRWSRLAGRASWPATVEIDDTLPAGLSQAGGGL